MPVNRLSLRKKEHPNGVSEGFTLLLDKRPVGEWQTPDYGLLAQGIDNFDEVCYNTFVVWTGPGACWSAPYVCHLVVNRVRGTKHRD